MKHTQNEDLDLFENDNIRLRAIEPEDLELLYRWENDTALWVAGNARKPYSHFALKQYIADFQKDIYETKQLRLMLDNKLSGETMGTVDLFDFDFHNSRVTLGLFVENKFQGKGYATQALHLIENYVFNFLKINQLHAFIAVNNVASIAMFRKEKYHDSALLKSWLRQGNEFVDVVVCQKIKEK
jgi:diamine N-acetyltransferase